MVRAIDEFLQKLSTNVALFNGLDVPRLERLVTGAERVNVAKDKLFFNEGDIGYNFFILLKGQAIVEKKDGHDWAKLAELGPGETFGEMALIDDSKRSATVTATVLTEALVFEGARFKAEIERNPKLKETLQALVMERTRANVTRADASREGSFMAQFLLGQGEVQDIKGKPQNAKQGDADKAEKDRQNPKKRPPPPGGPKGGNGTR